MNTPEEKARVMDALSHVVEEAGEMLAAAGKTQRYGLWSTDPTEHARLDAKGRKEPNVAWLTREVIDLIEAIKELTVALKEAV